jgi:2-oxoglutarate ferredoxin oxidoreductase subunit beta
VPPAREITASYAAGAAMPITMHDGSRILLCKLDPDYDPTDRVKATTYLREKLAEGEYVTGLIHIDERSPEYHEVNGTSATPINQIAYEKLNPGSAALTKIMSRYR